MENTKSPFKQITGWLLLFIFFAAIFFCITAPIELRNAKKSQSWEARDLEIQSSKVIRRKDPDGGYHFLIEIIATDLANSKRIKITNVRYGDMPFTISGLGKLFSSDHEQDVKKYPAGARVVGYKDPDSERYVLEKGDTKTPLVILLCSALWLLGNVFIMIRYPKPRKKPLAAEL